MSKIHTVIWSHCSVENLYESGQVAVDANHLKAVKTYPELPTEPKKVKSKSCLNLASINTVRKNRVPKHWI